MLYYRDPHGCWRCDFTAGDWKKRAVWAQWLADPKNDEHWFLLCGKWKLWVLRGRGTHLRAQLETSAPAVLIYVQWPDLFLEPIKLIFLRHMENRNRILTLRMGSEAASILSLTAIHQTFSGPSHWKMVPDPGSSSARQNQSGCTPEDAAGSG